VLCKAHLRTVFLYHLSGVILPVPISPGCHLRVTVVIKGDNRKKHNSHEWFLQGFAEAYPTADLLFLSDCGSSYKDKCIRRLAEYLVEHPDYAAVTGMLCHFVLLFDSSYLYMLRCTSLH
jgi:cellulose synthase/poly-beta-1,6-N-acetylglucosamine synthase-like glycosyltransferase